MSERTCQLCGKPLSRIRVGGGEEFCSREHRTQYRLRRGMDRLQEANKVASLMRRRENPMPIAVSPVAEMVWQGYFQALPDAHPVARFPRQFQLGNAAPALPAASHIAPRPAGTQGKGQSWIAEASSIEKRAPSMALPRIRIQRATGIKQANAVVPIAPVQPGDHAWRAASLLGGAGPRKPVPPRLPPVRTAGSGSASGAFLQVSCQAEEGILLRVSRAVGFKLPTRRAPAFHRTDPVSPSMRWPELMRNGSVMRATALHRDAEIMAVPVTKRNFDGQCRWRPQPGGYPGTQPPKAMRIAVTVCNPSAAVRGTIIPWPQQESVIHGRQGNRTLANPALSPASRLLRVQSVAATTAPAGRVATVPFGSSDITLGYPEEEQSIQ